MPHTSHSSPPESSAGTQQRSQETPIAENLSSQKKDIYRHAGVITLFTMASRILGAVRDLVIAHIFGAGLMTDAFVQAFTIPNVLRRLTAEGSMTLAFIPIYSEIRETRGMDKAKIFAAKALGLVLWSTVFLTALGMIFSPQLVYLFAAGFASDPEKFQLTVFLTRLMFPYLIFVSIVAWAMGVLNAERKFAAPAAAPMFLNIGIISAAFLISPYLEVSIVGIGIGVLIGGILQVFLQIPSISRLPQSMRPLSSWKDKDIQRLLRLLGPSVLGVAVYQINIIVLRNIASFLPSGQVTYYYNANRLTELALGVFAFSFTMASFPEMSEHSAKANWDKMQRTLKFTLEATLFIMLPATCGLVAVAEPIIAMLYLHGAYTPDDVLHTALALQAFALGIPAVAGVRLLVAVFYAFKDTKTPVIVSFLSVFVTGILGWWWSQMWEVRGLALGLSVGTWFQFFLLWGFLLRRNELRRGWWPLQSTVKYFIVSCIVGYFAWQISLLGLWKQGAFSLYNWGIFTITLLGSVTIYFILLLIVKDSQAQRWLSWISHRKNK